MIGQYREHRLDSFSLQQRPGSRPWCDLQSGASVISTDGSVVLCDSAEKKEKEVALSCLENIILSSVASEEATCFLRAREPMSIKHFYFFNAKR